MRKDIMVPFQNRMFVRSEELLNKNLSYYLINKLVSDGILKKINGNTYQNLAYTGEESEYLYIPAYVKDGVICLMSAAVFHGMSTFRTHQIDVGIPQKSKIRILPDWPKLGLFYFERKRYEIGITNITNEGGIFRVYDKEKTVCDLLAYRNKYGLEDCLSVLKAYVRRQDRDLNKLLRYAEMLNNYNILSKYLEVLL